MLKKILILLLISLTANNSYAADVTELKKDQPAPYTGFLFTPEKAQEVKNQLVEADRLKEINESYKRSIELYKDNEKLHEERMTKTMAQADNLAKNLYETRSTSTLEKFGYFFLGVLGTSLAVYGVKKATQ